MKNYLSNIIYLFVIVFCPFFKANTQDRFTDSLNQLIKVSHQPEVQLALSLQKIEHLRFIDADKALEECIALKNKKWPITNLDLKCEIDFQLGMIYFTKGDYVNCLSTANSIPKNTTHTYGKAVAYYLFGIVYDQEKKREKAREEYDKCLEMLSDTGHSSFRAELYNSLANNYTSTKNYDKAVYYFNKAIKINKEIKSTINLGFNLNNLANVYMALFKYKEAIANYNELLSLATKEGNQLGISLAYLNLGLLKSREQKYTEAENILSMGLVYAKKVKVKDIIRVYYAELCNINRMLGKYEKALDYYILSTTYADSLSKENTLKALAETEGKLKKKEDSLTIQKLENANLEQKTKEELFVQESRRKTILLVSAGIVLALMAVLILLVIRNNSKRKKLNQDLAREKLLVEHKNNEILDSLNYARHLQNGILPPLKIFRETFSDSFVLYKPKDIVAGDFYWLEKVNDFVFFAAADCTGHGVPGAMVSVVCSNALHRAVHEFDLKQPALILNKTRELVIETFSKSESKINDGMDISLCALNSKTLELAWAGANNPLWIIQSEKNDLIELKGDKQPVGNSYNHKPFTQHAIQLTKNDCLYTFTDGFADQFGGPNGKKFKYASLKKLLEKIHDSPMPDQKHELESTFSKWRGDLEQLDDVCIVGIRI